MNDSEERRGGILDEDAKRISFETNLSFGSQDEEEQEEDEVELTAILSCKEVVKEEDICLETASITNTTRTECNTQRRRIRSRHETTSSLSTTENDSDDESSESSAKRFDKKRYRRRHRFVTDSSLAFTSVTVVMLAVLAVLSNVGVLKEDALSLWDAGGVALRHYNRRAVGWQVDYDYDYHVGGAGRYLEDGDENDNGNENDNQNQNDKDNENENENQNENQNEGEEGDNENEEANQEQNEENAQQDQENDEAQENENAAEAEEQEQQQQNDDAAQQEQDQQQNEQNQNDDAVQNQNDDAVQNDADDTYTFYDESNPEDSPYFAKSCGEIYNTIPSNDKTEQCLFAQQCNFGEGMFASFVFCSSKYSTRTLALACSPVFLIMLVTLFRMLGSTAEDFFSPALEMFSVRLGLPPRFAGVSLLALGNGAADVSATSNAITVDPTSGYRLSLGALTGAGMFVSTVVGGLVIIVADGVPCRGALVRDVVMFLLALLVVYSEFASGAIDKPAIITFISMYIVFVLIVLVADVYHRRVVQPRELARREAMERARQLEQERLAKEAAALAAARRKSELEEELVCVDESTEMELHLNEGKGRKGRRSKWGRRPSITIMNSTAKIEVPVEGNHRFSRLMEALSNYGSPRSASPVSSDGSAEDGTGGGRGHAAQGGLPASSGWGIEEEDGTERLVIFHNRHGLMNVTGKHGTSHDAASNANTTSASDYQAMTDTITESLEITDGGDPCMEGGAMGFRAENWKQAFLEGREEFVVHWRDFWEDVYYNEDNNVLDKFLLTCEMPFTIFRKMTVPIPCDGYYCRPLVALSVALSPIWLGIYVHCEYEVNLFRGGLFSPVFLLFVVFATLGAFILRLAPKGDGSMATKFAVPIALYGFIVAATWIDFIADLLVNLLGFLGVVCHIPNVIMGLTVLAWGNSMGDMSANITMSKKGLANMAMTACFAGPVFNMLIGLGVGYSSLLSKMGTEKFEVQDFPNTARVGFLFLMINCFAIVVTGLFFTKGKIPGKYGYCSLALYVTYLVSAIWSFFR